MSRIIIAAVAAALAFSLSGSEMVSASVSSISVEQKKATKTVTFNVGLHCQNCVKKVKENISFEKGVKALEVNLEKKTVTVTYDPAKTDEATLKKAIEKLGYTCSKPE